MLAKSPVATTAQAYYQTWLATYLQPAILPVMMSSMPSSSFQVFLLLSTNRLSKLCTMNTLNFSMYVYQSIGTKSWETPVRQSLEICRSGCPADRHWALVRDDVPPLQYPQTGTCLQAASYPVHAAPPEEGSPDGVGPSSHVSGPWCEGA